MRLKEKDCDLVSVLMKEKEGEENERNSLRSFELKKRIESLLESRTKFWREKQKKRVIEEILSHYLTLRVKENESLILKECLMDYLIDSLMVIEMEIDCLIVMLRLNDFQKEVLIWKRMEIESLLMFSCQKEKEKEIEMKMEFLFQMESSIRFVLQKETK